MCEKYVIVIKCVTFVQLRSKNLIKNFCATTLNINFVNKSYKNINKSSATAFKYNSFIMIVRFCNFFGVGVLKVYIATSDVYIVYELNLSL